MSKKGDQWNQNSLLSQSYDYNFLYRVIRLLHYVDLFLKASSCIGSPVGTLLKEIFSGGPAIALKIKEEHIVRMMHLVFAQDEGETSNAMKLKLDGKMTLILALQALTKVALHVLILCNVI